MNIIDLNSRCHFDRTHIYRDDIHLFSTLTNNSPNKLIHSERNTNT
jgi:hypothetical protein